MIVPHDLDSYCSGTMILCITGVSCHEEGSPMFKKVPAKIIKGCMEKRKNADETRGMDWPIQIRLGYAF